MTTTRTRTRLSPADRVDQLLDTAKIMIINAGLQAFTMEALARNAGVSSPLVYNYFEGRQALLQALLKREYQRVSVAMAAEVAAAESFEEIVRISVASNFDHHVPGNILPILQSQPDINAAIQDDRTAHGKQIARFLVRKAASTYRLTTKQAQLVVRMSSGASISAAEWASSEGLDRDATIDMAVRYILAGLAEIANTG